MVYVGHLFQVLDDDLANVIMTPLLWAVSADGDFEFTVKLTSQPTHTVDILLVLRNATAVSRDVYEPFELKPRTLHFTPDDWMSEQTVTVIAGVRTEFHNRSYLPEGALEGHPGLNNSIFPYVHLRPNALWEGAFNQMTQCDWPRDTMPYNRYRFSIQSAWPDITTVIEYTFSSNDSFYNGRRIELLQDQWSADGFGNRILPRWQTQLGCSIESLGACNIEASPRPTDPYANAWFCVELRKSAVADASIIVLVL